MSGGGGESERIGGELQRLDLSGIQFPSDRLTIAQLRAKNPALFDVGFGDGEPSQPKYFLDPVHVEDDLGNMLFCERMMATFAYAETRGIDGPQNWDPESVQDDLIDYYRKFDLATGIKAATELVRTIRRQGEQLAQQQGR